MHVAGNTPSPPIAAAMGPSSPRRGEGEMTGREGSCPHLFHRRELRLRGRGEAGAAERAERDPPLLDAQPDAPVRLAVEVGMGGEEGVGLMLGTAGEAVDEMVPVALDM